jgi:uncharacterized protein (TIGR00661 family)
MKILYGVCGDGMGHAMRSAVVARHLENVGHRVNFASSGSALNYLSKMWPGQVTRVAGLTTVVHKNGIAPEATVAVNALAQVFALPLHALSFLSVSYDRPDVVVSDFDPWTARYAWLTGTPLVAVDNVHFMNRCDHPAEAVLSDLNAAALMFPTVENMVPGASEYLVTTFVNAPVRKSRTSLHLPILRPEVLAAKCATDNGHIVAYFNDRSDHEARTAALSQVGVPVRLYGQKGRTTETTYGNLTLCPFSDASFIADMANCRAVIGGAGFTFMTEAIYLGKPMLALPFRGQFEQILNANYLQLLGYGERCCALTGDAVRSFLGRVPFYADRLRSFVHDGNSELLTSVVRAIHMAAPRRAA